MTSALPRSASICGFTETPPKTEATFTESRNPRDSSRSTSPTCTASSRVGTSTSACVRRKAGRCMRSSRCSSARPKAPVLPEPVGARAMRSVPCSAGGSAALWMGVGPR